MLDATETATLRTFMEIHGREGLTAAIRRREKQFEA